MKKIVVVVDGSPIRFNEETSEVYYNTKMGGLLINDVSNGTPTKIAAFMNWDYWYYDDEKIETPMHRLRNMLKEPKQEKDILTEKPNQIDLIEKWFFDRFTYSPRLQEPRRLAQEFFRLEKLMNSLSETDKSICRNIKNKDKSEDILNALGAKYEAAEKEQEKIEKDIVKYFKNELPRRLASRYLQFFPKSRWYEK